MNVAQLVAAIPKPTDMTLAEVELEALQARAKVFDEESRKLYPLANVDLPTRPVSSQAREAAKARLKEIAAQISENSARMMACTRTVRATSPAYASAVAIALGKVRRAEAEKVVAAIDQIQGSLSVLSATAQELARVGVGSVPVVDPALLEDAKSSAELIIMSCEVARAAA